MARLIGTLVLFIIYLVLSGCHSRDPLALVLLDTEMGENQRSSPVPVPTVTGPITGGVRNRPNGVTADDPESFGYVAKEYFIEGTATAQNGTVSPYKTRMLVLKPIDAEDYRGTVVMEWLNVTSQQEAWPVWNTTHEHLVREGFAYIAVSVQKAGVDGSPLALKTLDPVRYGELNHPGDDFSFDIWSQAAKAILIGLNLPDEIGQPDPLEGFSSRVLISAGHSQSASRIISYINSFHASAQVFDGFLPLGYQMPDVRADLSPVLGVYGEWAAANEPPQQDGEYLIVWEVAGAAHGSYWNVSYGIAAGQRNRLGPGSGNHFDREESGQFGEKRGGPCPQNFFPDRYAWHAAIHHLENWILLGLRPPSSSRIERDVSSLTLLRDNSGNVLGGLRLPPLEVPVATYTGNRCELLGDTVAFDQVTLGQKYSSHDVYISKMNEAIEKSVGNGYLLRADAEDLIRRAINSNIGESL